MAIQSQPSRIPEPFAGNGTKNTIPATNSTPSASQAASWASGFPPECSQPIGAGGCPVPRNDMNGALNWLSQDFAFRQDGGIWWWSPLADYDSGRIVRGSDGQIYMSLAQSGPSLGGAVDPTTDSGAFWASPQVKTMLLADYSASAASTKWVKEIAVADVYLDPAGSDSNDGLSASTPVATFAKAVQIAAALPSAAGRDMVIQVAAGSYTGDLSVENSQCRLVLAGNVTITGRVGILNSRLLVSGTSYKLTVAASSTYSAVEISQNSYALFNCALTVTQGSTGGGIAVTVGSKGYFIGSVAVGGGGSGSAVLSMTVGSAAYFQGNFVVADNAGYSNGITLNGSCYALFGGGLWIGSGSVSTYTGLSVASNSACVFTGGTVSLRSGSGVANVVNVANGSSVMVDSGVTSISFLMYSPSGSTVLVERGSSFACRTTGNIYFGPSGVNLTAALTAANGSSASLIGSGNVGVDGTYASIVWSYGSSAIFWDKLKTTSSVPNGKRYNANYCSSIEVDGAGENHIPGNANGTVYNYSYYG